jgi:N-acetyl-anhydromuramyl-L-alanine amidase AmpD
VDQPRAEEEMKKEEEKNDSEKEADKNDDEEKEEKSDDDLNIKDKLVSWGFSKSNSRTIDTIIVHSSYNALGGDEYDVDLLIDEYKEYGVSPHYLIDRKGKIYRLVEDKNIAWHAGVSEVPDGRKGANAFSIGVELINNKEDECTKSQYSSLNDLIDYLKGKYKMKYVLGHDEVSPGRKTDPWNFDWDKVER